MTKGASSTRCAFCFLDESNLFRQRSDQFFGMIPVLADVNPQAMVARPTDEVLLRVRQSAAGFFHFDHKDFVDCRAGEIFSRAHRRYIGKPSGNVAPAATFGIVQPNHVVSRKIVPVRHLRLAAVEAHHHKATLTQQADQARLHSAFGRVVKRRRFGFRRLEALFCPLRHFAAQSAAARSVAAATVANGAARARVVTKSATTRTSDAAHELPSPCSPFDGSIFDGSVLACSATIFIRTFAT